MIETELHSIHNYSQQYIQDHFLDVCEEQPDNINEYIKNLKFIKTKEELLYIINYIKQSEKENQDNKAITSCITISSIYSICTEEQLFSFPTLYNKDILSSSNYLLHCFECISTHYPLTDTTNEDIKIKYFCEIEEFVNKLPPVYSVCNFYVYYNHLTLLKKQKTYDLKLFKKFLQCNRLLHYPTNVNKQKSFLSTFKFLNNNSLTTNDISIIKSISNISIPYVDMNENPMNISYNSLVYSSLEYFLLNNNQISEFSDYFDSDDLQTIYDEILYTHNMPISLTTKNTSKINQLDQQVMLSFLDDSKKVYLYNEPINIEYIVKNIQSVTVNIYQLNLLNYYKQNFTTIVKTDINLDGIISKNTFIYTFNQYLSRERHVENIDTSSIIDRGVYIIDISGSNISSRFTLFYGNIHPIVNNTLEGHSFKLLNENNSLLSDESIYILCDTIKYTCNKDHNIIIPYLGYNTVDQNDKIIYLGIKQDSIDYIQPYSFNHLSLSLTLELHTYLNPKCLYKGNNNAQILFHPSLYLNKESIPFSLSQLTNTVLTITLQNKQNINTILKQENIIFSDNKDYEYTFVCNDEYMNISANLDSYVNIDNKPQLVSASINIYSTNNNIHRTMDNYDYHLYKTMNSLNEYEYHIALCRNNGYSIPDYPVQLKLQHIESNSNLNIKLTTDSLGTIHLGTLSKISAFSITSTNGNLAYSIPKCNDLSFYNTIYVQENNPLPFSFPNIMPFIKDITQLKYHYLSLYSTSSHCNFVKDFTDHIELNIKENIIYIKQLPYGTYKLYYNTDHSTRSSITIISIYHNQKLEEYDDLIMNENTIYSYEPLLPLSFYKEDENENEIIYNVSNCNSETKAHLLCDQLPSSYSSFMNLASSLTPEISVFKYHEIVSCISNNRTVPEEYMYIDYRKQQKVLYNGNDLPHPGMLIHPLEIRSTITNQKEAKDGDTFMNANESTNMSASMCCIPCSNSMNIDNTSSTCIDTACRYRTSTSFLVPNLNIDNNNHIVINKQILTSFAKNGYILTLFIYNEHSSYYNEIISSELSTCLNDKQLKQLPFFKHISFTDNYDPSKHINEKNTITECYPNELYPLADITDMSVIQTISDVYTYYQSEHFDSTLKEFSFICKWNTLSNEKKHTYYKKYNCHELNYFIYCKDREYFDSIILPLLKCKIEKDFFDRYLLQLDLSYYLKSNEYNKLNTFEKILLISDTVKNHPNLIQLEDLLKFFKNEKDDNKLNTDDFTRLFKLALSMKTNNNQFNDHHDSEDSDTNTNEINSNQNNNTDELDSCQVEAPKMPPRYFHSLRGGAPSSNTFCAPKCCDEILCGDALPQTFSMMACNSNINSNSDCINETKVQPKSMGFGACLMSSVSNDSEPSRESSRMFRRGAPKLMKSRCVVNTDLKTIDTNKYAVELDQVKEYGERYYYSSTKLHSYKNIPIHEFWYDYLMYCIDTSEKKQSKFISKNFIYCYSSFTEKMLALSILDLDFTINKNIQFKTTNQCQSLITYNPCILFHKQLFETNVETDNNIILLQHYISKANMEHKSSNEIPHYTKETELLPNIPYICEITIINTSAAPYDISIFYQIPECSYLVDDNDLLQNFVSSKLESYSVITYQYSFYFSEIGTFKHYPVHIRDNNKNLLISYCTSCNTNLIVNSRQTHIDKSNVYDVFNCGTNEEIIEYLMEHKLTSDYIKLLSNKLYDKCFYQQILNIYKSQKVYNSKLYSFSLFHYDINTLIDYLSIELSKLHIAGDFFKSSLFSTDKIQEDQFQIKEFKPLINSRKYKLGTEMTIGTRAFKEQYEMFLDYLTYKKDYCLQDYMILIYYLFLQDRVTLAIQLYTQYICKPKSEWKTEYPEYLEMNTNTQYSLIPMDTTFCQIQFDYLSAYISCYTDDISTAQLIANKYINYPDLYWKEMFDSISSLLDRSKLSIKRVHETNDILSKSSMKDTKLPSSLSLKLINNNVYIRARNIESVTINYYKLNLEYLFSISPFSRDTSKSFSYIQSYSTQEITIYEDSQLITIPKELENCDIFIEARSDIYTSNLYRYNTTLDTDIYSSQGYITVFDKENYKLLSKVYIKVYSKNKDDSIHFFKDGYTDISGSFDYCKTSSYSIKDVMKFAIFISSDEYGSMIKEIEPPSTLKNKNIDSN